jgi:hypothetical protein
LRRGPVFGLGVAGVDHGDLDLAKRDDVTACDDRDFLALCRRLEPAPQVLLRVRDCESPHIVFMAAV